MANATLIFTRAPEFPIASIETVVTFGGQSPEFVPEEETKRIVWDLGLDCVVEGPAGV